MHADTLRFLEALFTPCEQGFITFSAIHPGGSYPTPSRHVRLGDRNGLARTLERLLDANRQGWGAYIAVATRKTNLGRWRRGGHDDLLALPALFVDVDEPSPDALRRLQNTSPSPSCITFTGGGYHAYWWLDQPLHNFYLARGILHSLGEQLGGDRLSPAQSLRLPGTHNTKARRDNALCEIVVLRDVRYMFADFGPVAELSTSPRHTRSRTCTSATTRRSYRLNPALIAAVTERLLAQGYRRSGDWLSGPCLYPVNHKHGDLHPSFGFNTQSGYGFCYSAPVKSHV